MVERPYGPGVGAMRNVALEAGLLACTDPSGLFCLAPPDAFSENGV